MSEQPTEAQWLEGNYRDAQWEHEGAHRPTLWVEKDSSCPTPDGPCGHRVKVPFDPSNPDHRREVLEALGAVWRCADWPPERPPHQPCDPTECGWFIPALIVRRRR